MGVVDGSGWFKTGDWHDVLYRFNGFNFETVKFSADTFTGSPVVQCHFLKHEDYGCMGYVEWVGTEGDVTGLCPAEGNPWGTSCDGGGGGDEAGGGGEDRGGDEAGDDDRASGGGGGGGGNGDGSDGGGDGNGAVDDDK